MNHATIDQFPCYPLLAKCWKESYIIELLPTWNASIHQYKINGGSYPGDRPRVLFSPQRMTGLLLEEGKEISAVFFDLTKAFDSVPDRQLIAKLEAISLNAYLINWIKNYLTHRI